MDSLFKSIALKPQMSVISPHTLHSIKFSSTSFHFFRIYFDFLYYLGYSPFRYKRDCDGKNYLFYTSRARKIFCIIVHAISSTASLSLGREYNQIMGGVRDQPKVFTFTTIFLLTSHPFVLIYLIWAKQSIIKLYMGKCQKFSNSKTKENKKVALAILICILSLFGGILTSSSWQTFRAKEVLREMAGQVMYNLYMQDTSNYTLDEHESLPSDLMIVSVIYAGLSMYAHVIVSFFGIILLFAALSIRQISIEFWNQLQVHRFNARSEKYILQQFYYISDLVEFVNNFTGPAVLTVLLSFVPLLASGIANLIDSTGDVVSEWIRTIIMATASLVPLIIAADASWRFDKFKDWLLRYENDERIHNTKALKLNMVFMQISNNPMGVRGCGLFTITYRFVGSALSIIVTYSILAFQMQGKPVKQDAVINS